MVLPKIGTPVHQNHHWWLVGWPVWAEKKHMTNEDPPHNQSVSVLMNENYHESLLTPLICSICSCQDPAQMPDVFKQLSLSRAAQGSLVFVEIFNLCLF